MNGMILRLVSSIIMIISLDAIAKDEQVIYPADVKNLNASSNVFTLGYKSKFEQSQNEHEKLKLIIREGDNLDDIVKFNPLNNPQNDFVMLNINSNKKEISRHYKIADLLSPLNQSVMFNSSLLREYRSIIEQ